jgi:dienelactone hydrolase
LREALEQNDVHYKIDVFPDADHGFTQPSGPAYNHEAAEGAWEGTLELLRRRLTVRGRI